MANYCKRLKARDLKWNCFMVSRLLTFAFCRNTKLEALSCFVSSTSPIGYANLGGTFAMKGLCHKRTMFGQICAIFQLFIQKAYKIIICARPKLIVGRFGVSRVWSFLFLFVIHKGHFCKKAPILWQPWRNRVGAMLCGENKTRYNNVLYTL